MASSPATAPPPDTSTPPAPPTQDALPPSDSPPAPPLDSSPPESSPTPDAPSPSSADSTDDPDSPSLASSSAPSSSSSKPSRPSSSPHKSSSSSRSKHDSDSPTTPTPSDGSSTPASRSPSNKSLPSQTSSSDTSPTKHDSGVDLPLVLGITAGVGIFLVLMIVALVLCTKKKKKKQPNMHYYDGQGLNGGYYQAAPLPKWQNGGQGMDYMGQIPPPPGAAMSPAHGWHQSAMPQMASSDMSAAYSGLHGPPLPPPSPNVALGFNQSTFTYDELAAATNGFSRDNLLGQGGFGYVYKGVLPNRKDVAVKQLKSGSGQGEREFQAEVEIISRVHHRHLVSLVGYCIAGSQRLLVYEFVPNNTLEHHLHGKGLPTMDWATRLKIAVGSAKGLAYLHEDCHPRIIHRDIKTANILLDNKFEAMVADFGLAKLSSDTNTHVSTRVMGTFGYLAPEYASSGKLTDRSDVFSFGVMLLELITGRRPVDTTGDMDDSLVDWARPLLVRALADENFDELVDPRLENNYDPGEMARMASSAAAAVRHSARRRPRMSQIVRALEGDMSLEHLNEGGKPGQSTFFNSSSDFDSGSYSSNMRRFRQMALESTEYSNEYSGATSEYGLNPSESSSSGEMKNSVGSHRKNSPPGL